MKVATLLVICFLVSSSMAKNSFDYTQKRSIMHVMMEVEAKLKTKAPLDAILNVLIDFRDAVNTEQVHHDEIYSAQQAECESENNFRSAQVTDASTVLRDSSASLTRCQNGQQRTASQMDVNVQQSQSAQQHLDIVLTTREKEQEYFRRRSQDYEDALHNIDEGLDIIDAISSGKRTSFVEMSKVAKHMLQDAVNTNSALQYAPVLSVLAQLSSKERQLDESALERAIQLLDNLRSNVQEAYNEFATSNAAAVSAFNDQKERLTETITRLATQNERLQEKLDAFNQCIGTQSAIAQTASGKLQRNSQLWDQAKALCNTFDLEYNYATSSRRHELQLVAELEHMVEERFNQVEDESHERAQRIAQAE